MVLVVAHPPLHPMFRVEKQGHGKHFLRVLLFRGGKIQFDFSSEVAGEDEFLGNGNNGVFPVDMRIKAFFHIQKIDALGLLSLVRFGFDGLAAVQSEIHGCEALLPVEDEFFWGRRGGQLDAFKQACLERDASGL